MSKQDLVQYAMQGEKIASGTIHADNIAPSMLGGFTLIRSMDPLEVLALPTPKKLCVVMIHPHVEIKTSEARKLVLQNIPLKTAITHWANTAALVKGLYESDLPLIGRCMSDLVAEPGRKKMIPLFSLTKEIALGMGADGFSISGAGPSMVALCKNTAIAASIKKATLKVFAANGIGCDVLITKADTKGARVIR
jgi:homoserine kinase